jgi:hypothetical protein
MNSKGGAAQMQPLAVTVNQACHLSGFKPTSVWKFLREGRLEAIRIPGCRRTLVSYRSLVKLVEPSAASEASRRRGRPHKRLSVAIEDYRR